MGGCQEWDKCRHPWLGNTSRRPSPEPIAALSRQGLQRKKIPQTKQTKKQQQWICLCVFNKQKHSIYFYRLEGSPYKKRRSKKKLLKYPTNWNKAFGSSKPEKSGSVTVTCECPQCYMKEEMIHFWLLSIQWMEIWIRAETCHEI